MQAEITRETALRSVLSVVNNMKQKPALISTAGKLSRELYELNDADNNFYMMGSMGCVASFGLGISYLHPDKQILVLDGDGSLLMRMGVLATIGKISPNNFHHFVFDNGVYDSTGGQETASKNVDFPVMAAACGYKLVGEVYTELGIPEATKKFLSSPGPTFLRLSILPGARKNLGRIKIKPEDIKKRFYGFLL